MFSPEGYVSVKEVEALFFPSDDLQAQVLKALEITDGLYAAADTGQVTRVAGEILTFSQGSFVFLEAFMWTISLEPFRQEFSTFDDKDFYGAASIMELNNPIEAAKYALWVMRLGLEGRALCILESDYKLIVATVKSDLELAAKANSVAGKTFENDRLQKKDAAIKLLKHNWPDGNYPKASAVRWMLLEQGLKVGITKLREARKEIDRSKNTSKTD